MNLIYPVVFTETNDKENPVLVYIPDINGMTEGRDLADAISMAKDYICNSLFDKKDSELPAAKRIGEIVLRRNITLPQWLDDMATTAKLNVSAITQSALKKELGLA